jgi:phage terminase Nu1 subunit (DNA packaging protein)
MICLENPDAICTGAQLAVIFGLRERQIDRLRISGVLKPVRCKRRGKHYRLADSVQSYLAYREKYVAELVKGNDDEYMKARASRMTALAEMETLRLKEKRGELVRLDIIQEIVGMMITNTRDRLRAIPSRLMHPLRGEIDPLKINVMLGDEIDKTLTELADEGEDPTSKFRREVRAWLKSARAEESPNGEQPGE